MMKFITNCLEITKGSISDYERMSGYHYQTNKINPSTNLHCIKAHYPYTKSFPDPIAIVVYRMPITFLRPRTKATNGFFTKPKGLSEKLKLINKHIRYLARIIVHPNFRRIGLATWLLKTTLPKQNIDFIETLTPVDFTNKLFKNVGFETYYTPASKRYKRIENALLSLGLTDHSLDNPEIVQRRIDCLNKRNAKFIKHEIKIFLGTYKRRSKMKPGIEQTKFLIGKLQYPQAYSIWRNPQKNLPT